MVTMDAECHVEMGHLTTITVRMVGDDGWCLDDVVVYDMYYAVKYDVQCHCWFDSGPYPAPGSQSSRTMTAVNNGTFEPWL